MVRPKKPLEELSPKARRDRLRREENPKIAEAHKKYHKESYRKNKPKHQLRKKLKVKQQREFAIEKLGSKCASCGELYNPNLPHSNLEFDHKFYMKGQNKPGETFRQVLRLIENQMDPKIQFAVLCRSCHMIVTYIRKYPQKSNAILDYLKKEDIMKTNQ